MIEPADVEAVPDAHRETDLEPLLRLGAQAFHDGQEKLPLVEARQDAAAETDEAKAGTVEAAPEEAPAAVVPAAMLTAQIPSSVPPERS